MGYPPAWNPYSGAVGVTHDRVSNPPRIEAQSGRCLKNGLSRVGGLSQIHYLLTDLYLSTIYFFPEVIRRSKSRGIRTGLVAGAMLSIAVLAGCSSGTKEQRAQTADSTGAQTKEDVNADPPETVEQAADTTHRFIKRILNASPREVAKILGNPDSGIKPTRDCVYLPSCSEATYRNKRYGVHYYNNALKSIIITHFPVYNKHVVRYLGFPEWEPSIANKSVIEWRGKLNKAKNSTGPLIPVPGIITITVTPHRAGFPGLVILEVEAGYNGKF
jgi:hypothetical protein